jgi:hypothetical protein
LQLEIKYPRVAFKSLYAKPGNAKSGRLSTVDLLIRVACFEKKIMFVILKIADLN